MRAIADRVCRDLRAYSEFDRVMVYQFDDDYNGAVIAEACAEGYEPFLGLHYPSSDIPPQARELYRKSWLRIIRDVNDEGSPICARADFGKPLDLTFSTLRSVSPVHIQYLKNMGVHASMSISLLTPSGELWGLIACHHYDGAKFLNYPARAACIHYAMIISTRLTEREERQQFIEKSKRREKLPQAIQLLFANDDVQSGLVANAPVFMELLEADGLAICDASWVESTGSTPDGDVIAGVNDALDEKFSDQSVVSVESLNDFGISGLGKSAGVLRIKISADWQLLVFRDEHVHSVTWGGNPEEAETLDEQDRLTPRGSFEAFVTEVRGRCRRWTSVDMVIANEVRSSLAAYIIQQNQRLAELNTELASRNSEIQQFAYSVSHDLKSPLVTVNGFIEAVLEDLDSGDMEEVRHSLDRIRGAVSRMGALIEDLLAYSRVGKHDGTPAAVDVKAQLVELGEDYEPLIADRGIVFELEEEYPEVIGYDLDVRRAFQNLVENAIKYMPEDAPVKRISIGANTSRKESVFSVSDTGAGIAPEYHERIFGLFERLHRDKDGTGVGLATVAKIMEQHGGRITLESELGSGATFHLHFPRAKTKTTQ